MGDPIFALIEPSPIIVEQRDVSATVMDTLAREPVKQVRRTTSISLEAQVSWTSTDNPGFRAGGQGGPVVDANGYLVFNREDLTDAGVVLNRGDRITSIGGVSVDLYFSRKWQAGHGGGIPQHEYWDFLDYDPSKAK